ncbi:MAG: hypothetical protein EB084_21690, partial [Proteobacteria bacterium]|nr:hypothetical protein [Pseudomonadota bacterium]
MLLALFLRPASGQTPTLVLQAGHTSPVTAVAFSRDGRFLASVAADGQIALWDMQARALLHTARGGGGTPRVLAFAPDGRTLATGASSGAVVTWDVDTLTPRRTDTAGDAPVAAVAFSPDGRRLAAATWRPETHVIAVFDTDTGTPYPPLAASGGAPRSLAFSPDGATIALGVDGQVTGQNLVELWDSRAGHLARVVASPAQAATCVSFDPSGRLLAATTPEGTVELFDMATLGRVASIRLGGSLACVAWAPEGGVLAAAGSQGGAICSVGAGAAPRPLQSDGPIRALAWSPDGTLLAGGEGDGHISLWSPLGGRIAGFSAREAFTWTPAFSPDGLLALRGWRDEAGGTDILEWSSAAPVLRALTLRAEPATPTSRARGDRPRRVHAFAPRNEQIATGTPDGRVIITDTRGRVLRTFGGHAGAVTGLAFSADGASLVSGGADGTVRLWTLATGRLALRLAIGQPVRAVAVSLGA